VSKAIRTQRILIVDDEAVIREALHRALSSGYEILSLSSGEQLEQILNEFEPGLVILDVRLPSESGLEICARLRNDSRFNTIPLMFLSGLGDQASIWEGYASGGDYYMTKPFYIHTLNRIVQALVGPPRAEPVELKAAFRTQTPPESSPASRFLK
jgi:DNA-binding response OmpR family regulator